MRPRKDLHFAEHMAEVFSVSSRPPTLLHVTGIRNPKAGAVEHGKNLISPGAVQRARIHPFATGRNLAVDVIGDEQLARVSPQVVERLLHALVTLGRSVA